MIYLISAGLMEIAISSVLIKPFKNCDKQFWTIQDTEMSLTRGGTIWNDIPNQYGTDGNCYQIGADKTVQNRDKQSWTIHDTEMSLAPGEKFEMIYLISTGLMEIGTRSKLIKWRTARVWWARHHEPNTTRHLDRLTPPQGNTIVAPSQRHKLLFHHWLKLMTLQ